MSTPLSKRSKTVLGSPRPQLHCAYKMLRNPRYECPRIGKMYQESFGVHYCAFHDSYAKDRCQAFFEHLHAGMRCSELGLVVDTESGRKFCAKHDPTKAVEFCADSPTQDAEIKVQAEGHDEPPTPKKVSKKVSKKVAVEQQRSEVSVPSTPRAEKSILAGPRKESGTSRGVDKRSAARASRNSVCVITPRQPLSVDVGAEPSPSTPVLKSPTTPALKSPTTPALKSPTTRTFTQHHQSYKGPSRGIDDKLAARASRNSVCVVTSQQPVTKDVEAQPSPTTPVLTQHHQGSKGASPDVEDRLAARASRHSVCVVTPRQPLTEDVGALQSPTTPGYSQYPQFYKTAIFEAAMIEESKDRIASMYLQCNICLEKHTAALMSSVPNCGHRYRGLCLSSLRRKGLMRKYNCSSCRDFMRGLVDE